MSQSSENVRRVAQARRAVKFFTVDSGNEGEPLRDIMIDLMADLMHLAKKEKIDVVRLVEMAHDHFTTETAD